MAPKELAGCLKTAFVDSFPPVGSILKLRSERSRQNKGPDGYVISGQVIQNRNGLVMSSCVSQSSGTEEREATIVRGLQVLILAIRRPVAYLTDHNRARSNTDSQQHEAKIIIPSAVKYITHEERPNS